MSSAAVSEEEVDAYFAKWYPEIVSADYSTDASQVEIDDYFERHYPDLVAEGAASEDASVDFTIPMDSAPMDTTDSTDAADTEETTEPAGTLHKHNGYYHTHDIGPRCFIDPVFESDQIQVLSDIQYGSSFNQLT